MRGAIARIGGAASVEPEIVCAAVGADSGAPRPSARSGSESGLDRWTGDLGIICYNSREPGAGSREPGAGSREPGLRPRSSVRV